ncbi:hypothetical protein F511_25962 [Dorcoceras hygrometricum]|uniref:Uncharacterized protein n=1 Tax=Dorcoceras hygrometricum TaxID=472368 RepID=A0A2Z7C727_9LAMI|nr:hypothetical protein F511_25962 [Dorcoceras hygrometricum]
MYSMKTSDPKAQQSLALWLMVKDIQNPSTYTPDPSSVERAQVRQPHTHPSSGDTLCCHNVNIF